MTKHYAELNYDVLTDLAGSDKHCIGVIEALKLLEVEHVIDTTKFMELRGFEPDIGSIFIYGGGSFVFDHEELGSVGTCNGTIISIRKVSDNALRYMSDIYQDYLDDCHELGDDNCDNNRDGNCSASTD